ncbi:DNA/RNA non-specific endonuclease [uncultured Treponema sp.]|uniref:DNA/RNA non-specific endonuclease n=1 Tax=uncultured Treponema sp. TaxID=162155 RepID=UPI0025F1BDF3|nr:DNA/RNA non-specific endonuclease [uncultured Treponema sp.]
MKKLIFSLLLVCPLFAEPVVAPVANGKNAYTIQNTTYELGFAENYGLPVWEMHELTPPMMAGLPSEKDEWKIDTRVKGYRITPKDLTSIKLEAVQLYPKSHALNDYTAQDSAFFLSNVLFMHKQLKESVWDRITKSFEELTTQYGRSYVYSGPIFEKEMLKVKYMHNNKLAVPTHFYRIILYFDGDRAVYKCYCIPNRIPTDYERGCDLEEFSYNLYQLEAETNIDFFSREIDAFFRQDKMKYLEKKAR